MKKRKGHVGHIRLFGALIITQRGFRNISVKETLNNSPYSEAGGGRG